ncbi:MULTISPECIES: PIN/TRAM domain-containing protein [Bacillaceae]|uniref:PIN/TRAM domain-containing protein n=1 Tax=Bacillaceae TaxID=186817 RepID=UPI000BFBC878|nr:MULTISPECIES: PIN/TRAM domain-containing protein [Bacillaceae]MCM3164124.1 PIN/TRAM domain-containing protein [Metabacillus litoralis]PGT84068.1 PIN domain nuclease [Bacillus sp. AFS040349]UGB33773.1 PIN/TRAM domain-containing protein [Metabacillus sp. B2-18]
MLKRIFKLFIIVVGGTIGIFLIPDLITAMTGGIMPLWMSYLIGFIILFFTIFWLINSGLNMIHWMEEKLLKVPITNVLFGSFGLILGLVVAFLITSPLKAMSIELVNTVFPISLTILFGYLGYQVGSKKRNDLVNLFLSISNQGEAKNTKVNLESVKELESKLKILDTSVILDGRIEEICKTGFLEGTLLIPQFVLEEVQHIADSSDVIKRNRGRRSLDTLNKIQKEPDIKVEIYEGDFNGIQEVDKFVEIAKLLNGSVVTNDTNLNKICNLHDVKVLSINDLAEALKPVVLPGEKINVQVIKDGKDDKQAIAYLDDGTMIVVEQGRDYLGEYIDVLVTRILQTSAGRMIFAKPII